MFALILALHFNPVNHQTTWEVYQEGFTTEADCVEYAQDHQTELANYGALSYTCDELK